VRVDVADETTRTQVPEGATGPDVVAPPERGRPLVPDAAAGIGESSSMAPSFAELVWAHFLWRHQLQGLGVASDGRDLEVPLERAYRRKLEAFEARNGRIVDAYWCRSEASAVAITRRDPKPFSRHVMRRTAAMRFHAATDWKTSRSPGIAALLQDCQTLAIRAGEVLGGTSQWIAIRWIMSVASFLLARCDAESPRLQDKRRTAATTQARAYAAPKLRTIESYYLKAAEKRARMVYVWGMVQGIIGFAVLIGLVGAYLAATSRPSLHDGNAQQLAATVVAGAVGALISVLLRMDERRTSTFKIDAEIGGRAVRRLGLFRTTVGAILATAVFCALKAGLVQQIKLPSGASAIYFYMVVAFLSGFSERWAQIVLGSAETVLAPAAPAGGAAEVPQAATAENGAEPAD
jgi:uncharacterized membrane protein YeaQ/YmgE (transglycosylase-associated protein family)